MKYSQSKETVQKRVCLRGYPKWVEREYNYKTKKGEASLGSFNTG